MVNASEFPQHSCIETTNGPYNGHNQLVKVNEYDLDYFFYADDSTFWPIGGLFSNFFLALPKCTGPHIVCLS